MNELKTSVEQSLASLGLRNARIDVTMDEAGNVIATLESPQFDGLDEAERQAMVWNQLRADLPADEQARVEFVFTRDSSGN